jgi:hypothetical protein
MRIVLKWDEDQPRDESGKWTSAGGSSSSGNVKVGGTRVGTIKFPASRSATIKQLSRTQFRKLPETELQKTLERTLRSPGGNTLSGIYANISMAYGQAPDKDFARIVDTALKNLKDEGKIKVVEVERQKMREVTREWVSPATGKLVNNAKVWEEDKETGEWKPVMQKSWEIQATDKIPKNIEKMPVPSHTLGLARPDRFEPEKNGLAQKALDYRRETFPDSRMSPMGRYFSSSNLAPELMLGENKPGYKRADGTQIYNRNEYFAKKSIYFFDATSSVTAHVGAMTGDLRSLQDSKLIPRDPGFKPAHHEVAKAYGVKDSGTSKPYFASLSGTNPANALKASDFEGLRVGGDKRGPDGKLLPKDKQDEPGDPLKHVAKEIWTPSSYGSPLGKATTRAMDALREGGMKNEALIKSTAQKMVQNFKETAMYSFTKDFKAIIKEAPANFVYTNPMSGFKMSFNEYKGRTHTLTLDGKEVSVKLPTEIAKDKNGNQKFGSASPLFIQNWDAAVIGQLMKDMKSPYTAHDAIGIKKAYQKDLNKAVVKAMNMVKNFNPLKDLTNQIMRQHSANGMPKKQAAEIRKRLNRTLNALTKNRPSIPDFVVNHNDPHFQPEFKEEKK